MKRITKHILCMALAMMSATSFASQLNDNDVPFGVNLACGDFGSVFPGEYNTHYTYPTDNDLVYWQKKGLMLVRMPFRWERLQHNPGGELWCHDVNKIKEFEQELYQVLDHEHKDWMRRIVGGNWTSEDEDELKEILTKMTEKN